jgi:pectate lyase
MGGRRRLHLHLHQYEQLEAGGFDDFLRIINMKLLSLFLLSVAAFSQATVNAPAVTLDAEGAAAIRSWMATQGTGTQTTLSAPVTATATVITVASSQGFAVNSVVSVGSEHMQVTARDGRNLTVTRGFNGTVAGSYLEGAAVTEMKYRTLNGLAKTIVVENLRQIIRQNEINAAQDAVNKAAEAKAATAIQ